MLFLGSLIGNGSTKSLYLLQEVTPILLSESQQAAVQIPHSAVTQAHYNVSYFKGYHIQSDNQGNTGFRVYDLNCFVFLLNFNTFFLSK